MKILDFIKRGIKGYSDSDVYDFDIWFINIIPKMLQELVDRFDSKNIMYPYTE